jgi:hypothetical protein
MDIRCPIAFAALIAAVVLSAGTASATLVDLTNPSFEENDDSGIQPLYPGVIVFPPFNGKLADGQQISYPSGWTTFFDAGLGANFVERNPTSAEFPGAAGDGVLPSPAAGSQAAFNASTFDNTIAVLSDVVLSPITFQNNMTYTLTVAIGQALNDPAGLGHFAGFALLLIDNGPGHYGSLIYQTYPDADNPTPGTFKDFILQFNGNDFATGGPAAPVAGDMLRVGFELGAGTYADNVRLDVSPAPEPSTLVLLASGLIGLSAYAWRKRR